MLGSACFGNHVTLEWQKPSYNVTLLCSSVCLSVCAPLPHQTWWHDIWAICAILSNFHNFQKLHVWNIWIVYISLSWSTFQILSKIFYQHPPQMLLLQAHHTKNIFSLLFYTQLWACKKILWDFVPNIFIFPEMLLALKSQKMSNYASTWAIKQLWWEKIWKIPNHKRDMANRRLISQMLRSNMSSGQKYSLCVCMCVCVSRENSRCMQRIHTTRGHCMENRPYITRQIKSFFECVWPKAWELALVQFVNLFFWLENIHVMRSKEGWLSFFVLVWAEVQCCHVPESCSKCFK